MPLKKHLVLLICSTLLAVNAFAVKSLQVKRVDDASPALLTLGEPSRQDCQVGNLNPTAWLIGDWVFGQEGYKALFYPPATCACPIGFHLESVHLLMNFNPEDVPVAFDIYADMEEAAWDADAGCWLPGPEVCISQVYTVQIDTDGLYDISIPIVDECECAAMNNYFLLSCHFPQLFPAAQRPDLVTDEFPVGCTTWNDFGFGWMDVIASFGWPGEILMWGDAACCELPVADAPNSWGRVKSLYR